MSSFRASSQLAPLLSSVRSRSGYLLRPSGRRPMGRHSVARRHSGVPRFLCCCPGLPRRCLTRRSLSLSRGGLGRSRGGNTPRVRMEPSATGCRLGPTPPHSASCCIARELGTTAPIGPVHTRSIVRGRGGGGGNPALLHCERACTACCARARARECARTEEEAARRRRRRRRRRGERARRRGRGRRRRGRRRRGRKRRRRGGGRGGGGGAEEAARTEAARRRRRGGCGADEAARTEAARTEAARTEEEAARTGDADGRVPCACARAWVTCAGMTKRTL